MKNNRGDSELLAIFLNAEGAGSVELDFRANLCGSTFRRPKNCL